MIIVKVVGRGKSRKSLVSFTLQAGKGSKLPWWEPLALMYIVQMYGLKVDMQERHPLLLPSN